MTEKCFDEGTIQAFLDGELDTDSLEKATRHISACSDCARNLREAETESTFAFSALNKEFNSLVPTERMRANLYQAIAAEKKSLWQKIFGANFGFSNPSVAALASLILVVGIFVIVLSLRESPIDEAKTQTVEKKQTETQKEVSPNNPNVSNLGQDPKPEDVSNKNGKVKSQQAVYKPNAENRAELQNANYKPEKSSGGNSRPKTKDFSPKDKEQTPNNNSLLGEESYVKTIATLSETVNNRKDEVLKPSAQVKFERELAVVDDAIAKMKKEVRKNPKNEAARQVLRASYQNKIDLLNSVAEKNELMATMR